MMSPRPQSRAPAQLLHQYLSHIRASSSPPHSLLGAGKKGAAPPVPPAPADFLPDLTKSLAALQELGAAIQPPDLLQALATEPLPAPRPADKQDWRVLRGEASMRHPTVRFAELVDTLGASGVIDESLQPGAPTALKYSSL